MCGSNLEAIYDKKLPKRLFPTDYLPDDYKGPSNGSVKDLISKNLLAVIRVFRPQLHSGRSDNFIKKVSFIFSLFDSYLGFKNV